MRDGLASRTRLVRGRCGFARIEPTLDDIEKLLPALSPGEKAQVLMWVVRDLGGAFPGVDARPEVCGGEPCIVRFGLG